MQKKSSSLDDGEEKCFLNLYITNGFINEKTKNSSPYFSSFFKTPIYENKKEKKFRQRQNITGESLNGSRVLTMSCS